MFSSLLFVLALSCRTTAARSYWSDKPSVIAVDAVTDGDMVEVSCTLPVDYRGGDCRLYRGNSRFPFKVMVATDYICTFHMTTAELLGGQPVGGVARLTCDYKLQQYTSVKSDGKAIEVWGSRPSPTLTVSRRLILPHVSVEVTCAPPRGQRAHHCSFLQDRFSIQRGSCSRNLTGEELRVGERPTLLLPVSLACSYTPDPDLLVRSRPSSPQLLFVLDVERAASSTDCSVSVSADQLEALGEANWAVVGDNGYTVNVTVSSSNLTASHTCLQSQGELMSPSSDE